jgi:starch-binding outer membrane protein SusE/F
MNNIKNIFGLLMLVLLLGSCKTYTFDDSPKGEALGSFRLSAPASNTELVLNSATPNSPVVISWTAATPGVRTAPKYTWILYAANGTASAPLLTLPSDNNGADNKLSLTHKAIDDALKGSFADGSRTSFRWTVRAENGTINELAIDPFSINITRFGDGVSNFILYGPKSFTSPALELDEATPNDKVTILWQPAKSGNNKPVTYEWLAVLKGGSFSTPLVTISAGSDTTLSLTQKSIDDALAGLGIAKAANVVLDWTVRATSGNFTKLADYVNSISITRFGTVKKMYMVGSFQGWTPASATEMIPDRRPSRKGIFYAYVNFPANTEFKFINGKDWNGTTNWGENSAGNIEVNGPNIKVPVAGVYRVTFNSNTGSLAKWVQPGNMYFVGAATPAGWDPGMAASYPLAVIGSNKWLGLVELTSGEFKVLDANAWPNGDLDKTRDYGQKQAAADGKLSEDPEDNMKSPNSTATAARYRLVLNMDNIDDPNYSITDGTMFLIGSATAGGWDNSATNNNLPPFSYSGNGLWTVTAPLVVGDFKFIAKKGSWDFNYGGTGGDIKEGGDNLKIDSAGSYTITVNEYTRKYTVTKN